MTTLDGVSLRETTRETIGNDMVWRLRPDGHPRKHDSRIELALLCHLLTSPLASHWYMRVAIHVLCGMNRDHNEPAEVPVFAYAGTNISSNIRVLGMVALATCPLMI